LALPLPPPQACNGDLGDVIGLHIATRQHLGDDRTVPTVAQGRVKKQFDQDPGAILL